MPILTWSSTLGNERRGINARGQFAPLQQFGVDGDVGVFRIHVLHAGDAERGGMGQSAFDRPQALSCESGGATLYT